ncbi:MAG: hypothetical protein ACXWUE_21395 [Polyangiales bacterium]
MMRRAFLLPTVLVSVACASRPWTPAISVAYWGEERPLAHEVHLPSSKDALGRWQLGAENPWNAWAKWTLFASLDELGSYAELPDYEQLDVVHEARNAARATAAAGLPEGTAVVLDLRGAASVAFGAELSRRAKLPVSLVPTFNNWPYAEGVIPADETLAALVAEDPGPHGAMGTPVFMLDAWRLAFRSDVIDESLIDNRYLLSKSDLPSASVLRAHGITRVIYVVESLDDTEVEEDDLHYAFLELQQAGVALAMVDLAYLSSEVRLLEAFRDHPLVVEPRAVLVDDPGFYQRSHGGFGGTHGMPSTIHGGPATS